MGTEKNGLCPNGIEPNGVTLNGLCPNGIELNGVQLNGVDASGAEPVDPEQPTVATINVAEVRLPDGTAVPAS